VFAVKRIWRVETLSDEVFVRVEVEELVQPFPLVLSFRILLVLERLAFGVVGR
jgi:hypothetical protein